MAVYAYLRVSTGKQDGENQRQGIDEFAKKRGFVIDEYIDDEGKSGTLEPEKRELGKSMADVLHEHYPAQEQRLKALFGVEKWNIR